MATNTRGNEMTVNATNAYRYSDNYSIETADGQTCYGCEHNSEEADAIARYLTNHHGRTIVVVRNGKDDVRAAKAFRSEPFQVKHRDLILKDMGVWS
jgi:Ni,Fe-hydrogenase I small subunit